MVSLIKTLISVSIFSFTLIGIIVSIFFVFNHFDITGDVTENFFNNLWNFSGETSGSGSKNKSCSEIEIPYQDAETYIYYLKLEDEYADNRGKIEIFGRGFYQQAKIGIKNLDDEGGWVTVTVNWKTPSDEWTDEVKDYVNPGDTIEFISEYDIDRGENNTFTYKYLSDPIEKTKFVKKYKTETVCN